MSSVPHIAVIVASTRSERFAEHPAAWLMNRLEARDDLTAELVDLREHPLPFYDLPRPPAMAQRQYTLDSERRLGEILDRADGFIVVTNEYNHGYSAALKNTFDHFYAEWRRKPAAFIGYGNVGGSRAIEQLRQVVAELEMVSIRFSVHLFGPQMAQVRLAPETASVVFSALDDRLKLLVDDTVWWAVALSEARASA